jgi:hypothetical protein
MDGLKSLLRSRKVALAVVGVAAVLLAEYSGLSTELQAAIITLFTAVILGIAHEDAGEKAGQAAIVRERLNYYVAGDRPDAPR